MTARFLHSFPVRNAFRLFRQNQKFAIVTCILQLLGIPLIMGSMMMEIYTDNLSDVYIPTNSWAYASIGSFCLGISVILGIFFGINAYHEEWDKSKVDMLYSLPLTGKQRFFSNYLGGLGMYLIPYLAASLIGWIVTLAFSPLVRSVLDMEDLAEFNRIYKYYFLLTLGLFLLMWMYYTISVLITSCCGTLFENIYTNILLNLLIPGTLAVLLAVVCSKVEIISFEYSWDVIGHTSPIGGLIYLIFLIATKDEMLSDYVSSYSGTYTAIGGELGDLGLAPAYIRWALIIVLLTIAILILAWRLYEHRKAEHVSKPFVYLGIYYVILTAIAVCILCITETGTGALIPVLIFSMIVYFIMEVIRKRGFKKFWMSAISYVITVVVTLGGLHIVSVTSAFGRAYYIPALASIASVKVEFETTGSNFDMPEYELNFSDKETISKIRDFHKICNENLKQDYNHQVRTHMDDYYSLRLVSMNAEDTTYQFRTSDQDENDENNYYYDDDYYSYRSRYREYVSSCAEFHITYYTVTGSAIYRTYDLLPDEYLNLLAICMETDTYTEATGNLLENRMKNMYQESYTENGITTRKYPDQIAFSVKSPAISNANSSYYISVKNYPQDAQIFTIGDVENNLKKIRTAYQNDLQNMTIEQFKTDEIICFMNGLPVYSCNAETCALLKEWGMKEFSLSANYADLGNYDNYTTVYLRIYAPEDYVSPSLEYATNSMGKFLFKPDASGSDIPCYESTCIYTNNFGGDLRSYNPALYDLLKVARTHYISNESCYVLVMNSNRYVIPPEYSDLVQKVIANGSLSGNTPSSSPGKILYGNTDTRMTSF
ncbi:MAG: hypothetical protein K2G25_01385 [Oscillospiraceae bacterium]|nr:hypothetical protein [Oscillospiraceae bacterium]